MKYGVPPPSFEKHDDNLPEIETVVALAAVAAVAVGCCAEPNKAPDSTAVSVEAAEAL